MSMLDRIIEQTKEDLSKRKKKHSLRDFESFAMFEHERKAFSAALRGQPFHVIAEIKKASPSKGVLRASFDPIDIARRYEDAGANGLSVLTDEPFFQGSLHYLEQVRASVELPLLRKDFMVDPYQIAEARAYGADAILLIAAVLSDQQLHELLSAAHEYGLEVLVECYDQHDVDRMPWDRIRLFGVNNRDLKTFQTDVEHGIHLLKQAPEGILKVSESGLDSAQNLHKLIQNQINIALIGEYFMRQEDPGKALSTLIQDLMLEIERAHENGEAI